MEPLSASASSISSTPVDQSIERRRVLQRIKNNEKSKPLLPLRGIILPLSIMIFDGI
jgi:hypothetical protein